MSTIQADPKALIIKGDGQGWAGQGRTKLDTQFTAYAVHNKIFNV
jgi:hypothetical protein